jgi:hypothetical protein
MSGLAAAGESVARNRMREYVRNDSKTIAEPNCKPTAMNLGFHRDVISRDKPWVHNNLPRAINGLVWAHRGLKAMRVAEAAMKSQRDHGIQAIGARRFTNAGAIQPI